MLKSIFQYKKHVLKSCYKETMCKTALPFDHFQQIQLPYRFFLFLARTMCLNALDLYSIEFINGIYNSLLSLKCLRLCRSL